MVEGVQYGGESVENGIPRLGKSEIGGQRPVGVLRWAPLAPVAGRRPFGSYLFFHVRRWNVVAMASGLDIQ